MWLFAGVGSPSGQVMAHLKKAPCVLSQPQHAHQKSTSEKHTAQSEGLTHRGRRVLGFAAAHAVPADKLGRCWLCHGLQSAEKERNTASWKT